MTTPIRAGLGILAGLVGLGCAGVGAAVAVGGAAVGPPKSGQRR